MSTPMKRTRVLTCVLAAALLAPAVARAQSTPTLGELAKKEQERRKTLKAAGKVVTDKDVPRAAPAPPPAAAAVPADKTAAPADKPQEPVKDEAYWRQRMATVREELRRNEMFAEALQTRINSLTADFSARDDPYQRAEIAQERAKAVAERDRVKVDIDATKKAIAEIEEEARRAGVPPGWLR